MPGNHDVYVSRAERRRRIRGRLRLLAAGERVGDSIYPFARKVGHLWLIALNSAKSNFWMWDATGKVGEKQLARLRELCAGLDDGPRIVVSHYPILTKKRIPEPRFHRLRDWDRVRDVAAECGVSLWLHGHRHGWYVLPGGEELPFASICAGSSTQTKKWGYNEYTIEGRRLTGLRRTFDADCAGFRDAETFELELPSAANPQS